MWNVLRFSGALEPLFIIFQNVSWVSHHCVAALSGARPNAFRVDVVFGYDGGSKAKNQP